VARIMPNAPSLIGQGINPVAYGASVTPEARELVEAILAALGETLVVHDDQMNWCVGLTGAAMRSVLPVLEGMTRAGVEAGFSDADSRRMAAQVMLGAAALALKIDLTFEQIKALTPMETVDEAALAQLFFNAARAAQEKITSAQRKLWPEPTG
jgi:pyrroline-5-carboxylate reductase